MITQCNHCGSTFEVSADLVYSRDPGVRCGECMSLFDARANVYKEGAARQTTTAYKPVQPSRIVETTDSEILESADTVVNEGFYQSRGEDRQPEMAEASGSSMADGFYQVPNSSGYSQGGNTDNNGSRPDNDYPDYQLNKTAASDLEFERTMATESALSATGIETPYPNALDRESTGSDTATRSIGPVVTPPVTPGTPAVTKDKHLREQMAAEEIRQLKLKAASERERRALAIEPQKPALDAAKMRQIEEFKALHRPATKSPELDDLVLSRAAQKDYGFIPDDVLQKPAVIRDDGRRDQDMQFESTTPRFEAEFRGRREAAHASSASVRRPNRGEASDKRQATRVESQPKTELSPVDFDLNDNDFHDVRSRDTRPRADQIHERRRRLAPVRESRARDSREPQARETDRYRHAAGGAARRDRRPSHDTRNRYQVSETSAQEMRRYQQQRPAMAVTEYHEDHALDVTEKTATKRRSGISPWLLLCGVIALACFALYAARNVIANMDLPEPIIGSFCQVTGCVPAQAKKDISQLQTMRKRLYAHPEIENALVISIDMVNQSTFKQAYPTVAIILLDAAGEPVAERAFSASDYEIVDRSESEFLMPDEPTRIKIEVVDGGLGATDVALEYK